MKTRAASVQVVAPDGTHSIHEVVGGRLTIGRSTPDTTPGLSLEPDPYKFVSRVHCVIERRETPTGGARWLLIDNASGNGTLRERNGETIRVTGSVGLQHGDSVLILADVAVDGEPVYWRIAFDDPFRTTVTEPDPSPESLEGLAPYLEYDWVQMKAFRVENGKRVPIIGLSPQSHKFVRYMADRCQKNNGAPVAVDMQTLIHMIWGLPEEWKPGRYYDETNLRNVINATRRRIERDPSTPEILQTERSIGYRLIVREVNLERSDLDLQEKSELP